MSRQCRHGYYVTPDMIISANDLFVKRSTIPGAGLGLFAKRPIPKGALIAEYKGKVSTWKEVKHNNGTNPYILFLNNNHVIDALPYKKALARFANDANGFIRVRGKKNNAVYVSAGKKAYIQAKKNIPARTEILVDYGKEYWDTMKYNQSI